MELHLDEHVLIVTGASAGIGASTAATLVEEGATVVGVARHPGEESARLSWVAADLARPGSAENVVAEAMRRHGRIDGVVNNVGALAARTGFLDVSDADWIDTFEVNFLSAVRMSRAALPAMIAAGSGSVVHVTSEAARLSDPTMVDYAATKTALLTLSKTLASEFGPSGIRSNVVSPGPTRTRLWDAPGGFAEQLSKQYDLPVEQAIDHFVRNVRGLPTGRLGQPGDVAHIIAYLVSPLAAQVTGAEWAVDGGALKQI